MSPNILTDSHSHILSSPIITSSSAQILVVENDLRIGREICRMLFRRRLLPIWLVSVDPGSLSPEGFRGEMVEDPNQDVTDPRDLRLRNSRPRLWAAHRAGLFDGILTWEAEHEEGPGPHGWHLVSRATAAGLPCLAMSSNRQHNRKMEEQGACASSTSKGNPTTFEEHLHVFLVQKVGINAGTGGE